MPMDREDGGVAARMRQTLETGLAPVRLDIVDESQLHAGHAGARPAGESHFRVTIVSAAFEGKNRVDRQRMVYGLLSTELENQIHALALKTMTPAEDEAREDSAG